MKKYTAWLPSILWMSMIFIMSAMPGETSSEQSGVVLDLLLSFIHRIAPGWALSPDDLHLLIRKCAHMAEYAVLALLNLRALRIRGAKHPYLLSLLMTVLYAASDECHQMFVPERGPSPVDVMIDSAGAAIGLSAAYVFLYFRSKQKNNIYLM